MIQSVASPRGSVVAWSIIFPGSRRRRVRSGIRKTTDFGDRWHGERGTAAGTLGQGSRHGTLRRDLKEDPGRSRN